MTDQPVSRFFVGLRPDPASAAALGALAARLAQRCRGRALPDCDLHLTLAFIGERPADEADRLATLLHALPPQWPGLRLDSIGRFGPALLWIGPTGLPGWLAELDALLRERLDAAGVSYDRRTLKPHLTLVRNTRDRAATAAAPGPVQPVEVAHWQLRLGGTHQSPTPERRYRWW